MSIRPLSVIAIVGGLAVKWVILLAAGLFISDVIRLKKEERNERNRTA